MSWRSVQSRWVCGALLFLAGCVHEPQAEVGAASGLGAVPVVEPTRLAAAMDHLFPHGLPTVEEWVAEVMRAGVSDDHRVAVIDLFESGRWWAVYQQTPTVRGEVPTAVQQIADHFLTADLHSLDARRLVPLTYLSWLAMLRVHQVEATVREWVSSVDPLDLELELDRALGGVLGSSPELITMTFHVIAEATPQLVDDAVPRERALAALRRAGAAFPMLRLR